MTIYTMPDQVPLCHVCRQPIAPTLELCINDAGYRVHPQCREQIRCHHEWETLWSDNGVEWRINPENSTAVRIERCAKCGRVR